MVVDINYEVQRVLPLLAEWVAPRLDGVALVSLQMPRAGGGAARVAALERVVERLTQAGCTGVVASWLFANGPCEQTLVFEKRAVE